RRSDKAAASFSSDRHRSLDMGVGLIAFEREVIEGEGEQVLDLRVQPHGRQREGLAAQLQVSLLDMVGVQVAVTAGPDELTGLQIAYLCHHQGQQRVAGNIEGYAEEDVRRALIELTAELAVGHIELEQ